VKLEEGVGHGRRQSTMQKTYVEEFSQADFTEDHIKQLCDESRKMPGFVSVDYKADNTKKVWIITTVINILS
jgi:hypothetical protein